MKNDLILRIIAIFLHLIIGSSAVAAIDPAYLGKQDQLIRNLTARGLSEQELVRVFSDSRVTLYSGIVGRSGKGLDYLGSRFGLLSRKSVQEGKNILQDNRGVLGQIETAFGVEKEILISIFRIETNFGRVKGNVPIFNSLLTLILVENRRSAWAEEELANLLFMCRDTQQDPLEIKGSWAGAFGLPQFVPSSYRKYGVDGNGDGAIDLNNRADALASMANYLKAFGWASDDPAAKKKAIYAYNHCDSYVQAVLIYARALKTESRPTKVKSHRSVLKKKSRRYKSS
jgi:membrane-bound lytic murein transglycosylase B